MTGGLVEQEQGRPARNRTRDGPRLPLAAGQAVGVFVHPGFITNRHGEDIVVNRRNPRRRFYVRRGHAGVLEPDVVAPGCREKSQLLQHHAPLPTDHLKVQIPQGHAVVHDFAFVRQVQAQKELRECALPDPVRPTSATFHPACFRL